MGSFVTPQESMKQPRCVCHLSLIKSLRPDMPMGHESAVYLPLVSNPPSLEAYSTQNKCRTTYHGLALQEVVLLFIILIQAVALAVALFTSSRDTKMTCMCPHSDRPLLYCRCSTVHVVG